MKIFYTGTWGTRSGIVDWEFKCILNANNENGVDKKITLIKKIKEFLSLVGDFGDCGVTSFTTESQGNDALLIEHLGNDFCEFEKYFLIHQDINLIEVTLDLVCSGINNSEHIVKEGASIHFFLSSFYTETVSNKIVLFAVLSLNVDLYSPVTIRSDDNKELSKLNNPRLKKFIRRIKNIGFDVTDVNAPYHPRNGVVNENGFINE